MIAAPPGSDSHGEYWVARFVIEPSALRIPWPSGDLKGLDTAICTTQFYLTSPPA
jgi:hypothetical protein